MSNCEMILSYAFYYDVETQEITIIESTRGLTGEKSRGVQAIVQQNNSGTGWEIIEGGDYFVQRPDGYWLSVDRNGLYEFQLDYCPNIAQGKMLRGSEWNTVKTEVNSWLERAGRPSWERK